MKQQGFDNKKLFCPEESVENRQCSDNTVLIKDAWSRKTCGGQSKPAKKTAHAVVNNTSWAWLVSHNIRQRNFSERITATVCCY